LLGDVALYISRCNYSFILACLTNLCLIYFFNFIYNCILEMSKGRYLPKDVENIPSLGKIGQINLEKMVQLHPDLIVGVFYSPFYELFSKIAPTIKIEDSYEPRRSWKDSFHEAASLLDKTQQAERAIAHYQQRVKILQQAIEHKIGKLEVSVSRFSAGIQNLPIFYTIFSFSGEIFQELGLSAPPQQLALTFNPDRESVSVSLERVDLLDADVLFAMLDPGSEDTSFKQYLKSPLWQKLNVVQNERVYIVDSDYWAFGNIFAANAILDDLFKYLVQEENINDTKESLNRN
ncbi:iron-siderophore ABC transporter substrate-binding protein, partial [Pleurocapsales cyanobacterium LEGE 06147]|nr:iron-siderophore ABC transporter substrate-binding protein [Pleurocapsales cyanobacterium LEGE 06147]